MPPTRFKVTTLNRLSCIISDFPFRLRYDKDTIVEALPGTYGVMCFKTEGDAIEFVNHRVVRHRDDYRILRIKPIGRGRIPKHVCRSTYLIKEFYQVFGVNWDIQKSDPFKGILFSVPKGTICYPKVRVLT